MTFIVPIKKIFNFLVADQYWSQNLGSRKQPCHLNAVRGLFCCLISCKNYLLYYIKCIINSYTWILNKFQTSVETNFKYNLQKQRSTCISKSFLRNEIAYEWNDFIRHVIGWELVVTEESIEERERGKVQIESRVRASVDVSLNRCIANDAVCKLLYTTLTSRVIVTQ